MSTYNGWPNRETWLVALWFDNDQATHEHWMREASSMDVSSLATEMQASVQDSFPTTGLIADLLNDSISNVHWTHIAEHFVNAVNEGE